MESKALEEYGIEADVLMAEYGPEQLVPPSPRAPGDEIPEGEPEPEPYPYVRAEQEKRLKEAERGLALLGKVNPLALEEYSAMEERHRFLTEQLDDLKRTREDFWTSLRRSMNESSRYSPRPTAMSSANSKVCSRGCSPAVRVG